MDTSKRKAISAALNALELVVGVVVTSIALLNGGELSTLIAVLGVVVFIDAVGDLISLD